MIKRQFVLIIFFLIIIFTGIGTRLYLVKHHFSHIDDIGVAKSIIESRLDISIKRNSLSMNCNDLFKNNHDFRNCLISLKQYFYSILRSFHTIPINWTYAPLQFYITNIFIFDNNLSYQNIKIMGRLPSFILEIFGIYLFFKIITKNYNIKFLHYSLILPLILFMFSWEAIIFSAQMQSYAIGILTTTIFLYLLVSKISNLKDIKNSILMGLICGFLVYAQYQSLIFIPGFYLAAAYLFYLNNGSILLTIKRIIESFLAFLIIFFLFPYKFLKDKTGLGINWNAGPNNEFAIPSTYQYSNILSALLEPIELFIRNYSLVLGSMLAPSSPDFQFLPLIFIPLTILNIIGYFSLFSNKNKIFKAIGIFITITYIIWILLIGIHKISFGPTRHSIVLIPFFIFCIFHGSLYLCNFMKLFKVPIILYSIFLFIVFIFSLKNEIYSRKDKFIESEIFAKLSDYSVNAVLNYDSSYSPYLMNSIRNSYPLINANIYMGIKEFDSFKSQTYGNLFPQVSKPYIIGLYSHISPFDFKTHTQVISLIKKEISPNSTLNYEVLYLKEYHSNTQIDWSSRTSNGSNGFYFYIYKFY